MSTEAIITLLAVLVALFGNTFWNWWNKPKIKFGLSKTEPHIVQSVRGGNIIWYFRIRIKNVGKTIARNCHIKIVSLVPESGKLNPPFEQTVLKWSSAPRDTRYREDPVDINKVDADKLKPIFREAKDIPPEGGWEMCDLFETEGRGMITFLSLGVRTVNIEDYIMTLD